MTKEEIHEAFLLEQIAKYRKAYELLKKLLLSFPFNVRSIRLVEEAEDIISGKS